MGSVVGQETTAQGTIAMENMMSHRITRILILVATLAGAGPAFMSPAMAQSHPPIPPPRADRVPHRPGPPARWVLEPGHWQWNGVRYHWVRPHWIARRPYHRHYRPGHWVRGPRGSFWVPGDWR